MQTLLNVNIMKEIPTDIKYLMQEVANKYANSPATTNAGTVLRLIAKFIPISMVIKLFAHKLNN